MVSVAAAESQGVGGKMRQISASHVYDAVGEDKLLLDAAGNERDNCIASRQRRSSPWKHCVLRSSRDQISSSASSS